MNLFTGQSADYSINPKTNDGRDATLNGAIPSITVDNPSVITVVYDSSNTLKVTGLAAGSANLILTATVGGVIISSSFNFVVIDPPPLADKIELTFLGFV